MYFFLVFFFGGAITGLESHLAASSSRSKLVRIQLVSCRCLFVYFSQSVGAGRHCFRLGALWLCFMPTRLAVFGSKNKTSGHNCQMPLAACCLALPLSPSPSFISISWPVAMAKMTTPMPMLEHLNGRQTCVLLTCQLPTAGKRSHEKRLDDHAIFRMHPHSRLTTG